MHSTSSLPFATEATADSDLMVFIMVIYRVFRMEYGGGHFGVRDDPDERLKGQGGCWVVSTSGCAVIAQFMCQNFEKVKCALSAHLEWRKLNMLAKEM